jgi:uncharacterized phage protein gp47/JayE
MPGPYPLSSLAPTIDANGISAPDYADILASKQASYRQIYGQDSNLASDTQDGQSLAIEAKAVNDTCLAIIDTYNAYSPATAQGAGLSSVVKINGLRRQPSNFSTAALTLIGQAGVLIPSGIVADEFNNQWTIPPNTVIPSSGSIIVTGTCATPGAIAAAAGTITDIVTIIPGWQSCTNASIATLGAPVETDAGLRGRQTVSTSLPAQTPLLSIIANVADVTGVTRYGIYNNDKSFPDANSVPGHSIAVVVEGGDVTDIATAISEKKNEGCGTYGLTTVVVIDPSGVPQTINFFVLDLIEIYFAVTINPLPGYVSTTGNLLMAAIAAAIKNLSIGVNVIYQRLNSAANLSGSAALSVAGGLTQAQLDLLSSTYEVTSLSTGLAADPTGTGDIIIAFNQAADCVAANGTLSVT